MSVRGGSIKPVKNLKHPIIPLIKKVTQKISYSMVK